MLRIAICDDDKVHIQHTEKIIKGILKGQPFSIAEYGSANELLFSIDDENSAPDIALLDIQMPDIDGISLAKELNRSAPDCKIIFISSYIGYAPDVYDTEHIYFVLKSQLEDRLSGALAKAIDSLKSPQYYTVVKSGSSSVKVSSDDLIYIERDRHKSIVHTKNGVYVTNQSPCNLLSTFPENLFIHCHQSYWVNVNAIQTMNSNSFKLSCGTDIPISRACKPGAKEAFLNSLR